MGALSHPVETEILLAPEVKEGLGVLHGNCSHCHNLERSSQAQATDCYAPEEEDNFDASLPPDLSALEDAPVLLTARFHLGEVHNSDVLERMSARNQSEDQPSMPPLGTEIIDEDGLMAVEMLIAEINAAGL